MTAYVRGDDVTDDNRLADALAKLQTQLPHIAKSERANTGTYSYTYADLAGISEKLLPIMGKLGLSFTCRPTFNDTGVFVLAYRLWHSSGDMLEGEYPLPVNGNAQAIGSAISYGRRYVLCSITGVAPDDDDDGAAASAHQATQTQPQAPRRTGRDQILADSGRKSAYSAQGNRPAGDDLTIANDKKRLAALHIRLKHYGIGDNRDAALAYMADVIGHELESSKELTVAEFRDVMDQLQADLERGTDVIPPEADPTLDEDPT